MSNWPDKMRKARPADEVSVERAAPSSELIRLEALKLAHRHDREPQQVLAVAESYLAWVLGAGPSA